MPLSAEFQTQRCLVISADFYFFARNPHVRLDALSDHCYFLRLLPLQSRPALESFLSCVQAVANHQPQRVHALEKSSAEQGESALGF